MYTVRWHRPLCYSSNNYSIFYRITFRYLRYFWKLLLYAYLQNILQQVILQYFFYCALNHTQPNLPGPNWNYHKHKNKTQISLILKLVQVQISPRSKLAQIQISPCANQPEAFTLELKWLREKKHKFEKENNSYQCNEWKR